MDRYLTFASLVLSLAISGCSATQSIVGKVGCSAYPASCGEDSCEQDAMPACGSETCQPLLKPSNNGCCSEGCSAIGSQAGVCSPPEGCGGCTGDVSKRRYSGLQGGFERGRKNIVLDGAGWVAGIPSKLLLWNTKVDSHSVSPETEAQLRAYLAANGLHDVKVRINQYDPAGEWKRLAGNKAVHPGWKYTVGALAVTKYTLLPGRLFGNDEFNPFTNSISLYSDRPSIALREGAHARGAIDATYRGLYSASMYMPGSPLWVDRAAIKEVLNYAKESGQRPLVREAYLVLFPAYGARVGQSLLFFADPGTGQVAQAGFAMIGHAVGRTMAFRVSENPMQMVKSVYGIVKRPVDDPAFTAELDDEQNPLPPNESYEVTFIPIEVSYGDLEENI